MGGDIGYRRLWALALALTVLISPTWASTTPADPTCPRTLLDFGWDRTGFTGAMARAAEVMRTIDSGTADAATVRTAVDAAIAEIDRSMPVMLAMLDAQRAGENVSVPDSVASHTLKNQMAIMRNSLLALRLGLPATGRVDAALRDRAAIVGRAALTLQAYAERGEGQVIRTPVSAVMLSQHAQEMAEQLFRGGDVKIEGTAAIPAEMVSADEPLITAAFGNLMTNARNATRDLPTPMMHVHVARRHARERAASTADETDGPFYPAGIPATGDYVAYTFRDNGPGMSRELLNQVWLTGKKSTTGGNGIGLPHVLSVVKAHGGAIEVVSKPGEGTAVTILLPRGEPVKETKPAVRTPKHLIVDDQRDNADSLQMLMGMMMQMRDRAATQPSTAYSGRNLIDQVHDGAQEQYIVTDANMPAFNLREFARAARAKNPSLVLVVLSGDRAPEPLPEGVTAWLTKPCDPDELLTTLDRHKPK